MVSNLLHRRAAFRGGSKPVVEGDYSVDISNPVGNTSKATGLSGDFVSMMFSPDGTKLYLGSYTNDRVYQFTLSTPWDITTLSSDSYYVAVTNPYVMVFSTDGKRMFATESPQYRWNIITLGTPYDLRTFISPVKTVNMTNSKSATTWNCGRISADGTRLVGMRAYSSMAQMDFGGRLEDILPNPYDVNAAPLELFVKQPLPDVLDTTVLSGSRPCSCWVSAGGRNLFMKPYGNTSLFHYVLQTPFEITSAVFTEKFLLGDYHTSYAVCVNDAGDRLYSISNNGMIMQFGLEPVWE